VAVEALFKVAEDPRLDYQTRAEAVRQIGLQWNREAVPRLIRLLPSPYDVVTREVILALGEIGDPRALPALRQVVADAEKNKIDFPPGFWPALEQAHDQIVEKQRSAKQEK
jgi:HEAT repeat protein